MRKTTAYIILYIVPKNMRYSHRFSEILRIESKKMDITHFFSFSASLYFYVEKDRYWNACKKGSLAADEFLSIYNYLADKEYSTAKMEGTNLVLEDKDFNTIQKYDLDKK